MGELPGGTVTFLFTDIEGSTRLWTEHPEEMSGACTCHDAILRDAVTNNDGVIYKVIGDAVQIAFASAPRAIAAAVAAQRALMDERWPTPEPLRVRMALHTGAVDPDSHGDYRSPVLNRLGRLLDAGHGGQVLISHATMELVRDTIPGGVSLRDLGEHRLNGLGRAERVYQMDAPELPGEFPPLRNTESCPNNLTRQPTTLIGRDTELADLRTRLARDDVRLVTLTGPGGTGKTRLACEIAATMLEHFIDGVFVVELASVTNPTLVAGTIIATLGILHHGDRSQISTLTEYLQSKHLLLVLDNLEQVIDAAPSIGQVLAGCQRLTVLATSRRLLRIRGEHGYPLAPLEVPDLATLSTVASPLHYDAVRLFVERAEESGAGFAVTDENAPVIAEICARLEGLPLAIELAAARIRLLPPETMLRHLTSRLPLLTGGHRDAPLRQQTMRDAIAWSYELLERDDQSLFRRLSIFAGGFTLEATETIAGSVGNSQVLDRLATLVDHSLIRLETDMADEPRYRMLEVVREFGLERLLSSDEEQTTRDLHGEWYLHLAREAESGLEGPSQIAWLDRLALEHDNLRAAIEWLVRRDRIDDAADLAGSIWFYFWLRGHFVEARRLYERLLDHPQLATATISRAKVLLGLGAISAHNGDPRGAINKTGECIAILRRLGEQRLLSMALNCHGAAQMMVGRLDESEASILESLRFAEAIGDTYLMQAARCNLGVLAVDRGQWPLAREHMEASIQGSLQTGNTWSLALGMLNLGYMDLDIGKIGAAEERIGEAARLIERLGDKRDLSGTYATLAEVALQRGDADLARARFEQASHAADDVGDPRSFAIALAGSAYVTHLQGNHAEAIAPMHEALRHLVECSDLVAAVLCLDRVAEIALAIGDTKHAAWCITAVDGVLRRHGQARSQLARADHGERVAAVVATLGEEAYERACKAGSDLDTDAVITRALQWHPSGYQAVMR